MIHTKPTKAQQRAKAASKLEESAMELIQAAEELAQQTGNYGRCQARAYLMAKARTYARALDALSRIG